MSDKSGGFRLTFASGRLYNKISVKQGIRVLNVMESASKAVGMIRESVCSRIKAYIMENDLPPRTKLPGELELAEMLGVSRASLREGIRMLEGAGLLTSRQGDGIYVAEYDGELLLDCLRYSIRFGPDDADELCDVHRALELFFIKEAADRLTEDQSGRLAALVDSMEACRDADELHRLDRAFHLTLFENVENRMALRLIRLYWDTLPDSLPPVRVDDHRVILRALLSGNPDFVRWSMRVHMFDSRADCPEELGDASV